MENRAEKADRWLQAIVKSCAARAEEDHPRKVEAFRDWYIIRDAAASLRGSQQAFENYRAQASEAMYDGAYPGRLAASYRWAVHFRLTVERATMLLSYLSNTDPPAEVDLTKTDWCD